MSGEVVFEQRRNHRTQLVVETNDVDGDGAASQVLGPLPYIYKTYSTVGGNVPTEQSPVVHPDDDGAGNLGAAWNSVVCPVCTHPAYCELLDGSQYGGGDPVIIPGSEVDGFSGCWQVRISYAPVFDDCAADPAVVVHHEANPIDFTVNGCSKPVDTFSVYGGLTPAPAGGGHVAGPAWSYESPVPLADTVSGSSDYRIDSVGNQVLRTRTDPAPLCRYSNCPELVLNGGDQQPEAPNFLQPDWTCELPTSGHHVAVQCGSTWRGDLSSSAQLIFDSTNWDVPQTVTVTARDDDVYEPEVNRRGQDSYVHHFVVAQDINLEHTYYDDIAVNDMTVSINDNDPAVVMENRNTMTPTEGGDNSEIKLRLASEPMYPVTIYLQSGPFFTPGETPVCDENGCNMQPDDEQVIFQDKDQYNTCFSAGSTVERTAEEGTVPPSFPGAGQIGNYPTRGCFEGTVDQPDRWDRQNLFTEASPGTQFLSYTSNRDPVQTETCRTVPCDAPGAVHTCKRDGHFITVRFYNKDGVESILPNSGYSCNSYVTFSTTNWNTWQALDVIAVNDVTDEGRQRMSDVGFLYESIDWYYNSPGARLMTAHNPEYRPYVDAQLADYTVDLSMFDTRFGRHINRYPRILTENDLGLLATIRVPETCAATDAAVCAAVQLDGDPATCTGAGACDHTAEVTAVAAVAEGCSSDVGTAEDNCVLTAADDTTAGSCAPSTDGTAAGAVCTYVAPVSEVVGVSESCAATDAALCGAVALDGVEATCTGAGACSYLAEVADSVTDVCAAVTLDGDESTCTGAFPAVEESCVATVSGVDDEACSGATLDGTAASCTSAGDCDYTSASEAVPCTYTAEVTAVAAVAEGCSSDVGTAEDNCVLTAADDTTAGSCAPSTDGTAAGAVCTYVAPVSEVVGVSESCAATYLYAHTADRVAAYHGIDAENKVCCCELDDGLTTSVNPGGAEDPLQTVRFEPEHYRARGIGCAAKVVVKDDDTRGVTISRSNCEATEGRRFWFDRFRGEMTPSSCSKNGYAFGPDHAVCGAVVFADAADPEAECTGAGLCTYTPADGDTPATCAGRPMPMTLGLFTGEFKALDDAVGAAALMPDLATFGTIEGSLSDNVVSADDPHFDSKFWDLGGNDVECASLHGDGWSMVDDATADYAGMSAPVCPYTIVLDRAPLEGTTVVIHVREDLAASSYRDHELFFYEEASYRNEVSQADCIEAKYPGSAWVNNGCFIHNVPLDVNDVPVPRGSTDLDVMFTDRDWNVPRRITVIALNDDVDEPTEVRTIYHTVGPCTHSNHNSDQPCREDPQFTGMNVTSIDVVVVDDDIADLVVICDGGYAPTSCTGTATTIPASCSGFASDGVSTCDLVGVDEGCNSDIGTAAENCVLTPATEQDPGTCTQSTAGSDAGAVCTYIAYESPDCPDGCDFVETTTPTCEFVEVDGVDTCPDGCTFVADMQPAHIDEEFIGSYEAAGPVTPAWTNWGGHLFSRQDHHAALAGDPCLEVVMDALTVEARRAQCVDAYPAIAEHCDSDIGGADTNCVLSAGDGSNAGSCAESADGTANGAVCTYVPTVPPSCAYTEEVTPIAAELEGCNSDIGDANTNCDFDADNDACTPSTAGTNNGATCSYSPAVEGRAGVAEGCAAPVDSGRRRRRAQAAGGHGHTADDSESCTGTATPGAGGAAVG